MNRIMLNNGSKITYRYKANGMRTRKQVGSKVTNYYYDSNNNLIAERKEIIEKNKKLLYAAGLIVE